MNQKDNDALQIIASYVDNIQANNQDGKGNYIIERYRRIKAYEDVGDDNKEKLNKAFKAIGKYAQSDDAVLSLFLLLPDNAALEVMPAIYGKRNKLPDAEQDCYMAIKKTAKKLRDLIMKPNKGMLYEGAIFHMIADLGNDDPLQCQDSTRELYSLPRLLLHLEVVAEKADPAKKYLTSKLKAKDAAKQSYIVQLAMLNDLRYLTKPQHAAISTIAMANNPAIEVSRQLIADAYRKHCKND
ncbi:MAG: hypothetical protein Q8Q76_03945 [Methylotenera sp.]|nr:hypothetical protein [Methylotenera sp.]